MTAVQDQPTTTARHGHADPEPHATIAAQQAVAGRRPSGAPDAPTTAAPHPLRIHGLDGLRAVAVAGVLVYHLGAGWLPGGFLGVDLFFVISGFLITTLLLAQARIDYKGFYLRRARRLLPALFLTLCLALVLAATVARDVAHQTARDVPGALLYVSNWWALGQEQSYFDLIGRGNMLGHLWSLAVEEQFYLIWPLVLGLILWAGGRRRAVSVVAAAGALASTIWMTVLAVRTGSPIPTDPTRLYFGTDTHAMSVLAGAALAGVWDVRRFRADVAPGARRLLLGVGCAGLLVTAALFALVTEYTQWLYRGGFLVAALVFALVVAAASHPASPLGPALDNPVMRWVGTRSYGIYLYHWPIFLVTREWHAAARLALVFAIAEASFRYVETPIRQGRYGTWWRDRRVWIGAAAVAAAVAASIATAPRPVAQDFGGPAQAPVIDAAIVQGAPRLTWYGDSVALWASDVLQQEFPGVRIDAGTNRAPTNIMSQIQFDEPGGTVVIHMGNAGPVPADQLRQTLTGLADADRVVLINSNADFPYVPQVNSTIAEVAKDFDNVVVVDWDALSEGRDEWFKDGLHLTAVGKEAYAVAVREALA